MAGVKLTKSAAVRMAQATKKIEALSTSGVARWLNRRVVGTGGGDEMLWGEVVDADIPARTEDAGKWIAGTGNVQKKKKNVDGDLENDGDPVEMKNFLPLLIKVGATVEWADNEIKEATCPIAGDEV